MSKVTKSFADKVAAIIGADPGYVFQILSQWEPWENANANHNPLATTQHAAGSRPLGGNPNQNNGNPVQEYPDEDTGAAATAKTLLNGYYPNLVNGLRNGKVDASAAPEIRTWGTTGFANQLDGGGTTMTQPSGGGRNYSDPALDGQYETLKTGFLTSQQAWIAAGRPKNGAQFDAMNNALGDLDDFTSSFGHPKSITNSKDAAQQSFENRISQGDFDTRQADSAFKKWYDKYNLAKGEATADYEQRAAHNKANIAITEARNTSQTPGLLPRATDAGYIEQSRSQLMDEYLKKMGISREAPTDVGASGGGVSAQGSAPGGDTANGPLGLGGGPVRGGGMDLEKNPFDARKPFDPFEGDPFAFQGGGPRSPFDLTNKSGGEDPKPTGSRPMDYFNSMPTLMDIPGIGGALKSPFEQGPLRQTGAAVKGAGKAAKRWWQRGFAQGGMNIPGGPAWVGEKGPEIMQVPGFGEKIVGQQGPEQVQIPEGANVIPVQEQFAMHQIQSAVQQGPQRDQMQQSMDQRARANDPDLQAKVMASLQKGMASHFATSPPFTPMIPTGGKDYWADWRELSGTPATVEEAMMQQQAAQKGAKR